MAPAGLSDCLRRHSPTGTSVSVQVVQLSLPENHDEGVSAESESVHHGLGDVDQGRHRDRGINRVASFLEDLQTNLGRQRLA